MNSGSVLNQIPTSNGASDNDGSHSATSANNNQGRQPSSNKNYTLVPRRKILFLADNSATGNQVTEPSMNDGESESNANYNGTPPPPIGAGLGANAIGGDIGS